MKRRCEACGELTSNRRHETYGVRVCDACLEQGELEMEHGAGAHEGRPAPACPLCENGNGAHAKEGVTRTRAGTPELDPKIIKRWQEGTSLIVLSKEVGIKRGKLRRILVGSVGGREAYRERRDAGAGGRTIAPGGTAPAVDDSDVPRISSARRSEGWRSEILYVDVGGPPLKDSIVGYLPKVSTDVFVSPDGTRYVRAHGSERADLVFDDGSALKPLRLKIMDESRLGRRVEKEQQLVEQGEKALEKTMEKKRERRQKRRARKLT